MERGSEAEGAIYHGILSLEFGAWDLGLGTWSLEFK